MPVSRARRLMVHAGQRARLDAPRPVATMRPGRWPSEPRTPCLGALMARRRSARPRPLPACAEACSIAAAMDQPPPEPADRPEPPAETADQPRGDPVEIHPPHAPIHSVKDFVLQLV